MSTEADNAPVTPNTQSSNRAVSAALFHGIATVLVVSLISLLMERSYDEVYWLGVVRKVALGLPMYDAVIDNKGPLWYLVFAMFEASPTSWTMARALGFAVLGGAAFVLSRIVLGRQPVEESTKSVLSAVFVVLAFAFSLFYVTIEIAATVLLLGAFALLPKRPLGAGIVVLATVLTDPRSVIFVPAMLIYARGLDNPETGREWRWNRRLVGILGFASILGLSLYLAHPDLRYAVVEIGFATRPLLRPSPDHYFLVLGGALLPMTAVVGLLARPRGLGLSSAARALAVPAVLLAILSAPFSHYLTYLTLVLPLLARQGARQEGATWIWVPALAATLVPLALLGIQTNSIYRDTETTYQDAIDSLSADLEPEERIVVFGFVPQLIAAFPEQTLNTSPVPYGMTLETSRRAEHLVSFEASLDRADALWVDSASTGLVDGEPLASFGPAWALVEERLAFFPCEREVPPLIVLEKPEKAGGCRGQG